MIKIKALHVTFPTDGCEQRSNNFLSVFPTTAWPHFISSLTLCHLASQGCFSSLRFLTFLLASLYLPFHSIHSVFPFCLPRPLQLHDWRFWDVCYSDAVSFLLTHLTPWFLLGLQVFSWFSPLFSFLGEIVATWALKTEGSIIIQVYVVFVQEF